MPPPIDEDLRVFLESRPGWIVLTTLDPDGLPHSVPMGYVALGDRIYLGCREGTRKVRNVDRDPRVSLMLATARGSGPQHGVMIQGTAEVVRDPADVQKVRRAASRLRGASPSGGPPADFVYLRVTPERIRRWTVGIPGA